jgi:hypothetical protein
VKGDGLAQSPGGPLNRAPQEDALLRVFLRMQASVVWNCSGRVFKLTATNYKLRFPSAR